MPTKKTTDGLGTIDGAAVKACEIKLSGTLTTPTIHPPGSRVLVVAEVEIDGPKFVHDDKLDGMRRIEFTHAVGIYAPDGKLAVDVGEFIGAQRDLEEQMEGQEAMDLED